MRFRGKRSYDKETLIISRVYSFRWEVDLGAPAGIPTGITRCLGVAYVPFITRQLPSGESTVIHSMEYLPKKLLLWITFWGYKQRYIGDKYVFYQIPLSIWIELNEASSKGRFFYYCIKGRFNYSRVN